MLASEHDGVAQAVDEVVADAHLGARDHRHAVGVEFQRVLDQVVLVEREHDGVGVRARAQLGDIHSFPPEKERG